MSPIDTDTLNLLDADLDDISDEELDSILWALAHEFDAPDRPGRLAHQAPPEDPWFGWLFSAGRGAGKTQTMADDFFEHMTGPPCSGSVPGGHRAAVVAPTLGDVASSCYEGPSGLLRIDRRIQMITRKGGTYLVFPNGAMAKAVGGDTRKEADRLRAHGNTCRIWVEEAAAIPKLGMIWDQILLSCRLGIDPRVTLSSTPRNTVAYRRILNDSKVKVTTGTMDDNVYLEQSFKTRVREAFAGTHMEAQEIDGQLVTETPGALWSDHSIDARRVNLAELAVKVPKLETSPDVLETHEMWIRRALSITTVYVGLDPATSGRGDRTGIVVMGGDNPRAYKDGRRNVYILEDRTGMMVPSLIDMGDSPGDEDLPADIQGWSEVSAEVAYRWQADAVVVERNRIGRTARTVLRAAGFDARIIEVDAADSKANRATPVRAAWSRLMWIVGAHPILEVDMTSWVPALGDSPEDPDPDDLSAFTGSPDALDAMVWPARFLLGLTGKQRRKPQSYSVTDAMQTGWQSG